MGTCRYACKYFKFMLKNNSRMPNESNIVQYKALEKILLSSVSLPKRLLAGVNIVGKLHTYPSFNSPTL